MSTFTTLSEEVILLYPNTSFVQEITESVADIHASCILRDDTVASFLPPLSRSVMIKHWQDLVAHCDTDLRFIFVAVASTKNRTSDEEIPAPFDGHTWLELPAHASDDPSSPLEVAGVITLSMPHSETGPFRGIVQKLFVSPMHRRKGVATALIETLEERAQSLGKWNLMLDTTKALPAERMYPKLGYTRLGTVKSYGYSPKDGSLVDEVFFCKDLLGSE